jgi:hypothetical protein
MIIPELQGKLSHSDFFIYTAADEQYFNEFGKFLINSARKNSSNDIHVHIFNPSDKSLEFCQRHNVSYSYEKTSLDLFKVSEEKILSIKDPNDPKYKQTINSMNKSNDKSVLERIQKTYYACSRFIRLRQLISQPIKFFSIDVDAIIRSTISNLPSNKDFYIHHITGLKERFLAGGIYSTGTTNSFKFLIEYASVLEKEILNDNLYWGLDQDLLKNIVPKYNFSSLPKSLIDWDMLPDSSIWTAKGSRKNIDKFLNEKKKYSA